MNTLKDYVNFKLTHADKVAEAESYPLTLTNCKKYKKMRDLKVYGNSFQDGTPTPDNPIEVVSVGEKSVNLFDKDNAVSLYASTTAIYNVTETGISCYCTTSQKNIFLVMDLGLASNFEGKNMRATMNCPIVTNEKYSNTMFCTCEADGSNRKGIGSSTVTNDEVYAAATIGTGYTTQRLCLRLYVHTSAAIDGYLTDTYYFNNIMVYEGTDKKAYEPYGKYKIPVTVRGVNLSNIDALIPAINGRREPVKNEDGSYTLTKGLGHDRSTNEVSFGYTIPKGTTLTFSVRFLDRQYIDDGDMCFFLVTAKGLPDIEIRTWKNAINANGVFTKTITLNEDVFSWQISMIYSGEVGMSFTFDNLQLEYGDTVTDYEPYIEPITTNVFLNEPLRKIGNYADYIDFKENKVVRNTNKIIFTGNEFLDNITSIPGSFALSVSSLNLDSAKIYAYCNKLESKSWGTIFSNNSKEPADYTLGIARSNSTLRFTYSNEVKHINSNRDVCKAQLKTWYDEGSPMYAIYLDVPTEEPLNIDLPKLNAKTTIIEVDTSLAPSNAYGKYIKK